MKKFINSLIKNKSGQSLTEYALILAVIAMVVVWVMTTMWDKVRWVFAKINTSLDSATALTGSRP